MLLGAPECDLSEDLSSSDKFADVPRGLPFEEASKAVRTSAASSAAAHAMLFSPIRTTEIPARSGSRTESQQSQTSGDTRPFRAAVNAAERAY